jgi:hypothetical protein
MEICLCFAYEALLDLDLDLDEFLDRFELFFGRTGTGSGLRAKPFFDFASLNLFFFCFDE